MVAFFISLISIVEIQFSICYYPFPPVNLVFEVCSNPTSRLFQCRGVVGENYFCVLCSDGNVRSSYLSHKMFFVPNPQVRRQPTPPPPPPHSYRQLESPSKFQFTSPQPNPTNLTTPLHLISSHLIPSIISYSSRPPPIQHSLSVNISHPPPLIVLPNSAS